MGRPPYDHWYICILNPVLAVIRAVHHTLEINLFKTASTRYTISKWVDVTNAEPMEYIEPKVTGTVKERYFIRTYFSKTRPLYIVLHQYRLFQGWNVSGAFAIRHIRGSKKVIGARKGR